VDCAVTQGFVESVLGRNLFSLDWWTTSRCPRWRGLRCRVECPVFRGYPRHLEQDGQRSRNRGTVTGWYSALLATAGTSKFGVQAASKFLARSIVISQHASVETQESRRTISVHGGSSHHGGYRHSGRGCGSWWGTSRTQSSVGVGGAQNATRKWCRDIVVALEELRIANLSPTF